MNFIRYDATTGEIQQMGWMDLQFIEAEIAEGKPMITHNEILEWGKWRVNPQTKELEQLPQGTNP